MDLQLGLALSSFPDKGFDLNCSEIDGIIPLGKNEQCNMFKKRDYFLEAFEKKNADHHDVPQTLPLLVWDNDQNNQGDDTHEPAENSSDNGVVGWPPINSWRKKICKQNQRGCVVNCVTVENGCETQYFNSLVL